MKQIIFVSDSHGRFSRLEELTKRYPNADMYLHGGDSEYDNDRLFGFVSVAGNNDMFYDYPEELVLNIEDIKVLVTHGHKYYYHSLEKQLVNKAKKLGCSVVCYGHTHRIVDKVVDGVRLLNPGSLNYNRDLKPISYMIISIDKSNVDVQIIEYK